MYSRFFSRITFLVMLFFSLNSFGGSVLKIEYIGGLVIKSHDPKQLKDYYSNFSIQFFEYAGSYYAGIDSSSGVIHFGIEKVLKKIRKSGAVQICFKVNDFDALIAHLANVGIHPIGFPPGGSDGRFAAFKDPQGNLFSIWGD